MCARTFIPSVGFLFAIATFCGVDSVQAQKHLENEEVTRSIRRGRELFTRVWQPRQSDGRAGDGLGPLFNERSCAACHKQGALGGGGPSANNVQIVSIGTFDREDPEYGTQPLQRRTLFPTADTNSFVLHRFGIAPQYDAWRTSRLAIVRPPNADVASAANMLRYNLMAEARLVLAAEQQALSPVRTEVVVQGPLITGRIIAPLEEQLAGPKIQYKPLRLAPLSMEERNTTALFGAGLLDRVSRETLEKIAVDQPKEVRGRPALFADGRVGRFGWKAQNVSLSDFNENACAVELGLETPVRHQAKMPAFASAPGFRAADRENAYGLDINLNDMQDLTAFTASLPVPRSHVPKNLENAATIGRELFDKIGCSVCHPANLGSVSGVYSDLLLHQMGGYGTVYYGTLMPNLAAARSSEPTAPPAVDEFRTPPLWGVADSAPYMHDGSAKTLRDAVLAHGVQGVYAGQKFRDLPPGDQKMLIVFLGTLRAPTMR